MFAHDDNVDAGAVAAVGACSISAGVVTVEAEPAGVEIRGEDGGLLFGDVADGLEERLHRLLLILLFRLRLHLVHQLVFMTFRRFLVIV